MLKKTIPVIKHPSMGAKPDSKDDLKSLPMSEVENKLGSSADGFTQAEGRQRVRPRFMLPLEQLNQTSSDTEIWTALQQMDRDGVNQLPVMRDSHVIGMLSREDVITFLRTLQELGT